MSSPEYQTLVAENQRLRDNLRNALKCIKVLNEMKIKVKTIIDSKRKYLTKDEVKLLDQLIDNCNRVSINSPKIYDPQIGNNQSLTINPSFIEVDENIVISEGAVEISEDNSNSGDEEIQIVEVDKCCDQIGFNDNTISNGVIDDVKCPIVGCDGQCGWDRDMNKFKEVHRIILKCPIEDCSEAFVDKSHLDEHLKNIHMINETIQHSFICYQPNCKQSFNDYNQLMEHINSEHQDQRPIFSSAQLTDHQYIDEIPPSLPELPVQVIAPTQAFITGSPPQVSEENPLIIMVPKTSGKPRKISSMIKCPFYLCENLFLFDFDLAQHIFNVHKIAYKSVVSVIKTLTKEVETKLTATPKQIKGKRKTTVTDIESKPIETHYLNHNKMIITKIIESKTFALMVSSESVLLIKCIVHKCNKTFTKQEKFCRHVFYNHKCPVEQCYFKAKARDELIDHLATSHSDYPLVKCSIESCNKYFLNESSMKHHIGSGHAISKLNLNFKCQFIGCGKLFSNGDRLSKHETTHSGVRPFKCDLEGCDYTAKFKMYLIRHKLYTHSTNKPFVCDHIGCGSAFKRGINLKYHKMSVHSTNRVNCPVDGCQSNVKKRQLKAHIQRVHSKPLLYCKYSECDYSTEDTTQLNAHKRAEHPNEYLKYLCDWNGCNKRFSTRTHLKGHIISHKNEKAFACDWPECQYRANTRQILNSHIKYTHKPEFKHSCHWPGCDKKFKWKGSLDNHLRVHTNEKPFVCDFPGCNYRSGCSYFYEHRKKHYK